ncbi:MAG: tandem-95 repeat protein [Candidatus Marinimicrobia bacterium]|nr:tandem-95 repeat protein [Candidatus Neomarinimicrobiota bacterium]
MSGYVSGTWESGSIILVENDIWLRAEETLIIMPGVTVKFAERRGFSVQGTLIAQGNEQDSIKFTSIKENPEPGDWSCISLSNNSVLSYCIIEYGGYTSKEENYMIKCSHVQTITDCDISQSLGYGIYYKYYISSSLPGSLNVLRCNIHHNGTGGISFYGFSYYADYYCTIEDNIISDNGGYGIRINGTELIVNKNEIYNNSNTGITSCGDKVTISNNVIYNHHNGGVYFQKAYGKANIFKNRIFNNYEFGINVYNDMYGSVDYVNIVANEISKSKKGIQSDRSTMKNNLIFDNTYGIYGHGNFSNNTIINNKNCGIYLKKYSQIVMNIFDNNQIAININSNNSNITNNIFSNNTESDFTLATQYGLGELITINSNGDSIDTYYNLYQDPLFVDSNGGDYHIRVYSPCIGAGNSEDFPEDDFEGNPRPNPPGSIPDIGAYENPHGTPLNAPPSIISSPDTVAFEDNLYIYDVEAVDIDGDSLVYSLFVHPTGMTIDPTTGIINWIPDHFDVGDTIVTVVVTDDSNATDTQTYTLIVINVNDPPVFSAIPDTSFDEDSQLSIALSYFYMYVDDPDNVDSTLSFVFNGTDDINASASEDSLLLYAQTNWNGIDTIRVIVSDESLSDTTSWRIIVNPVNDAPVITSADSVEATEDIYFKYFATAVDIEDSSITFDFEKLPSWLFANIDSVYGTPTEGMKDTSFIVIASDVELNDTLTVILMVISINDPPLIYAIPDTSFNEDQHLSFAFSYLYDFVHDPDNADSTLTLSFSDTNYVYVAINKDSVFLSAEKDWFGKDTLIVMVNDGEFSDTTSFVITVHPVNDAPYFTELMPDSIRFDSNVSDTLLLMGLASDIDNPDSTLIWSYIHSSFASCNINDTLDCAIFWVEENVSGKDTIVLSVSDGELTAYDSIIVIVKPVTGIDYLMSQIPTEYSLHQNYPNPFNPTTNIIYGIPRNSYVEIKIFDLLGREVTNIINKEQEAQYYKIIWDAKDRFGNGVSSGMYFYRIVAISGNRIFVKTKKLLLLR